MDATSIITQVSRDDEQLNVYPNDKGGKKIANYVYYMKLYNTKKSQWVIRQLKRRHNKDETQKKMS